MRRLAAALMLLLLPSAAGAAPPSRVALVVGNGAYRFVDPLRNPDNDARLMAQTLRRLGFRLVGGDAQLDLDRAGLEAAIRRFHDAIAPGGVAFFYYSGHGVQLGGANYLVPVAAAPASEHDVPAQMVAADLVLQDMADAGAALNVVVLDACRNNPFSSLTGAGGRGIRPSGAPGPAQGGSEGLAEMHAPAGTIISFATQPGSVAFDGAAGAADSPYTAALAQAIATPGLDVVRAFNRAGLAVDRLTDGRQEPWLAISPLDQDFALGAEPGAVAAPSPVPFSQPMLHTRATPMRAPVPPPAPGPAPLCPAPGLRAVRNGDEAVRYDGTAAGAPGLCVAEIGGARAVQAAGIWPASWPGAAPAEAALRRVLAGPPGSSASFLLTADVPGLRDTVTSQGWRFAVTQQGPASLAVGGVERPATRVLWQERNLSNPYQAQAEILLDRQTGAVLSQRFRMLVGGAAAAYDYWAPYGGGLAGVADFTVTALR